jgi:hypothetical protein
MRYKVPSTRRFSGGAAGGARVPFLRTPDQVWFKSLGHLDQELARPVDVDIVDEARESEADVLALQEKYAPSIIRNGIYRQPEALGQFRYVCRNSLLGQPL